MESVNMVELVPKKGDKCPNKLCTYMSISTCASLNTHINPRTYATKIDSGSSYPMMDKVIQGLIMYSKYMILF